MVNHQAPAQPLDLTFGALAHPIRRGIVARLAAGEATVSELAKPYAVSAPAISRHMRILQEAGIVSRRKQGREHFCRLEEKKLHDPQHWLQVTREQWNQQLDQLERYLEENP